MKVDSFCDLVAEIELPLENRREELEFGVLYFKKTNFFKNLERVITEKRSEDRLRPPVSGKNRSRCSGSGIRL